MTFENVLFWCEFPDKVNWEDLNDFFTINNYRIQVGVACRSRAEYEQYLIQSSNLSHIDIVRAWPILPKEKGYWFSSYTEVEDINSLDQYEGLPIKIDIEYPLPTEKKNWFTLQLWFLKQLFSKPGKNLNHLQKKIRDLSRTTDIMLSTFTLPERFLKKLGLLHQNNLRYNYIHYSSMVPFLLRPFYNIYFKVLAKKILAKNPSSYFAVGLLTPGIFGDEPCYKKIIQFEKDLKFIEKLGAKNVVVFRLGSFQELENASDWLSPLKY